MSVIPELLDLNFNDLSINDFIVRVNFIADKIENHPALKECPEYFSGPDRLREKALLLGQLRDAAAKGDREKRAEKMAAWEETKLAVTMNGQHIIMLSLHRNDPSILLNAGFELKQKQHGVKSSSTNLLAEAPQLAVKYVNSASGPVPGAIVVVVTRAKNTVSYELQMTENPGDDSSWNGLGLYSKARVEYKNQQSAKRLHFRARYHHDGGVGPWSQVVNILVL